MKFICPLCGKEHNLKKGFKDKTCEGKVPKERKNQKNSEENAYIQYLKKF